MFLVSTGCRIKSGMTILFFRPDQLRCLFIVELLTRYTLHLGFDVVKQVFHPDGTIRLYDILILDSFEKEVGKESVTFSS